MQDLAIIISTTLMYSTPLIYTALGGVFSENSGIVNIGLEGMMTIGAFAAAAAGFLIGNPWLAFLIGGIAGSLFALLKCNADMKKHVVACREHIRNARLHENCQN